MTKAYKEVEYCWVTSESWLWNAPLPDGKYQQVFRLFIELQDENKNKIARETEDVITLQTDKMVNVAAMQRLRTDEDIQLRIAEAVAGLKEKYAGY